MRLLRTLSIALILLATAPSWAADSPRTVRVLFIGNSLTYFNEMPSLFEDFAEAAYPNLDVVAEMVATPGETWRGHWEKGEALKKLQGAPWDYVVLQEQGALPLGLFRVDGVRRHERPAVFFEYGDRFASAAVAAKAKPVLYQTYEGKAPGDDLLYLDYAYMTLGKKTGALVAPVGRVWNRVRDAQGFNLYHEDGMHPSAHGSYLAAATIAATLWGDPPSSDAVPHPASVPNGDARTILAAVRSVREKLAPAGGYAQGPEPEFSTQPSLQSSLPLPEGTWTAKINGLELSLGTRLTVSLASQTPQIELIDFTLNGAFPLPIRDLSVEGTVLRFATTSQNRNYQLQVARRADGVEVLVEQNRNQAKAFTHARYRPGTDEYFDFLGKQFEQIASQTTQEGFEAALLGHYEALSSKLGAEDLSKILMGQPPLSHEWWAILAGWEYSARQQHDAAIRFETFATNRFPKSAEAFRNLGETLEKAGRVEDAYNAILRAESLVTQGDPPGLATRIQETKARLEKLKPAAASTNS